MQQEKRLTRKTFFGDYGWEATSDADVKIAKVQAINKLGRLEDLMEKFNIETVEELEKLLSR